MDDYAKYPLDVCIFFMRKLKPSPKWYPLHLIIVDQSVNQWLSLVLLNQDLAYPTNIIGLDEVF